jgi:hypothetical protein
MCVVDSYPPKAKILPLTLASPGPSLYTDDGAAEVHVSVGAL